MDLDLDRHDVAMNYLSFRFPRSLALVLVCFFIYLFNILISITSGQPGFLDSDFFYLLTL